MNESTEYLVTVTGYHTGMYKVFVKQSPGNSKTRYVTGHPFGCSRDYVVFSDEDAIRRLMNEHCLEVVDIQKAASSREVWSNGGRIGFYEE